MYAYTMRQGRALLSLADHCCCPVAASEVRRNDLTARAHEAIAQRVQWLPVWRRDGRHRACGEVLCAGRPICALWLSTEATSAGGRSQALAAGAILELGRRGSARGGPSGHGPPRYDPPSGLGPKAAHRRAGRGLRGLARPRPPHHQIGNRISLASNQPPLVLRPLSCIHRG